MKVIIGAGKTAYDGWISTQEAELNLLKRTNFERMFSVLSVSSCNSEGFCYDNFRIIAHLRKPVRPDYRRRNGVRIPASGSL